MWCLHVSMAGSWAFPPGAGKGCVLPRTVADGPQGHLELPPHRGSDFLAFLGPPLLGPHLPSPRPPRRPASSCHWSPVPALYRAHGLTRGSEASRVSAGSISGHVLSRPQGPGRKLGRHW